VLTPVGPSAGGVATHRPVAPPDQPRPDPLRPMPHVPPKPAGAFGLPRRGPPGANPRRAATAGCATDGGLLAMTEDQVGRLYFQDPSFGFHLVQLITRRLLENCATTEALPGRWPETERPHAKAAA
jgi:hypothetical protein